MKAKHKIYEFWMLGKKVVVHKGDKSLRVMHINETMFLMLLEFLLSKGAILPDKIKWKTKK